MNGRTFSSEEKNLDLLYYNLRRKVGPLEICTIEDNGTAGIVVTVLM